MTAPRRRRHALEVAVLLLVVALSVAGWASGVRVLPVLTGSMAPRVPAGSLVLTTPLDPDRVRVGDVVAFSPPAAFSRGRPVMHRVAEVTPLDGARTMRTRGDANPGPDPWTVGLAGADLASARLVVPHVGRIVAGGPAAAMLMAGGVVLLVAGASLTSAARRTRCTCLAAVGPAAPGSAPPVR